jgi:hypothetical protein
MLRQNRRNPFYFPGHHPGLRGEGVPPVSLGAARGAKRY